MRIQDISSRTLHIVILCLLIFSESKGQINFEQLIQKKDYGQFINVYNPGNINSPDLEFSPYVLDNGLIYVSSGQKDQKFDNSINENFFDLLYTEINALGEPSPPIKMKVGSYNELHEGPSCISIDGQTLYFTRNNYIAGISRVDKKGDIRLHIYEAQKSDTGWHKIKTLPFNDKDHTTCHPTISPDGQLLFFSANYDDSYGGMDLYMVKKYDGEWTDPVNLGPNVNSKKNELFPYFSYGEYLFFSSDRKNGLGGLDIYYSFQKNGEWQEPIALSEPINSEGDDFGLSLTINRFFGYFSSNRTGGLGKDDIYLFKWPKAYEVYYDSIQMAELAKEAGFIKASISVRAAADNYLLKGAQIWQFTLDLQGNVIVPQNLIENCGLDAKHQTVDVQQLYDILPKCSPSALRTNNRGAHDLLLANKDNYLVVVAHPNYISESFVINKSDENKNNVFKIFLEEKPCKIVNGIVSDPNAVPLNSKVTVVNNCTGAVDSIRTDESGLFEFCLNLGCTYQLKTEHKDFQDKLLELQFQDVNDTEDLTISVTVEPKTAEELEKEIKPFLPPRIVNIESGSELVLDKIYYDFNKTTIKEGAARELDVLANAMIAHPEMEIELIAHTDSRGGRPYNLNLSLERAQSAKKYLMDKGIDGGRIIAFGYGEGSLRNHCKDGVECTDEEHAYNRRTEVRVTALKSTVELIFKND